MLMICPWASVRGGPRFTSYIAYYNMNDDPKIEKKVDYNKYYNHNMM